MPKLTLFALCSQGSRDIALARKANGLRSGLGNLVGTSPWAAADKNHCLPKPPADVAARGTLCPQGLRQPPTREHCLPKLAGAPRQGHPDQRDIAPARKANGLRSGLGNLVVTSPWAAADKNHCLPKPPADVAARGTLCPQGLRQPPTRKHCLPKLARAPRQGHPNQLDCHLEECSR